MQASVDEAERAEAFLAIVVPRVLQNNGCAPIERLHNVEAKTAQLKVSGALAIVSFKVHEGMVTETTVSRNLIVHTKR